MKALRSHDDREIAGVCGGLAKNLGWDSGKLRIVWVLATIFTAFAGNDAVPQLVKSTEAPVRNPDVMLLETNQINSTNCWADASVVDLCAKYDANLVGLDRDVKHFYEMLNEKDWKGAYELRWKTFKRDIPEETYLNLAKQYGARWGLLKYEILTVNGSGTNDVTIICKFVESPGPKTSYATVEWHKEGDGVWRCNGAGPIGLPIFMATRYGKPPDDN